jgi:hypothetical protein
MSKDCTLVIQILLNYRSILQIELKRGVKNMKILTPMQVAIEQAANRGDDEAVDRLINLANECRIPADNPLWSTLSARDEELGQMQHRIQNLEQIIQTNIEQIQLLQTGRVYPPEYAAAPIFPKQKIPEKQKAVSSTILLLICSGLVGVLISAGISFFWYVPSQLFVRLTAQRGIDAKNLEYLSTTNGQAFRRMLAKNGSYFPNQCEAEARSRKLFLLVNGKKTTRLCVLVLPD